MNSDDYGFASESYFTEKIEVIAELAGTHESIRIEAIRDARSGRSASTSMFWLTAPSPARWCAGRVPVIEADALVLDCILELAQTAETTVSEHDILYGTLLSM